MELKVNVYAYFAACSVVASRIHSMELKASILEQSLAASHEITNPFNGIESFEWGVEARVRMYLGIHSMELKDDCYLGGWV